MGAITAHRRYFVESFIEIVGFKTGILVDDKQLFELLAELGDYESSLRPDGEKYARLHSVEVEEIIAHLLYRLGNIKTPDIRGSDIVLYHKYKGNKKLYEVSMSVKKLFTKHIMIALKEAKEKPPKNRMLDPSDFMIAAVKAHGNVGLDMAMEIIDGTNGDMHRSPWGTMRSVDWIDEVELKELFESEALNASYGTFFDQRYIDYLHQNFGDLGNIHWRKFEGLTAEFFLREGFSVDVGPGRNDDGIDLRITPKTSLEKNPALIIVQCKRQKAKIDKALVKAVYADVLHEKAKSGLIVTSSYLSPGAAKMRTARGYPVEDADRDNLRQWIERMRTT